MPQVVDTDTMYWTPETDKCVINYQLAQSQEERNTIFERDLERPMKKLAENISNAFTNTKDYIFQSQESLEMDILTHMVKAIPSFKPAYGKGYSYFTTVGKRFVILQNKVGYRNTIREKPIEFLLEEATDSEYLIYKPAQFWLSDSPRYQEMLLAHFDKYDAYYFVHPICLDTCRYMLDVIRGIHPVPESTHELAAGIRSHYGIPHDRRSTCRSADAKAVFYRLAQCCLDYYSEHGYIPDRPIITKMNRHPFVASLDLRKYFPLEKLSLSF